MPTPFFSTAAKTSYAGHLTLPYRTWSTAWSEGAGWRTVPSDLVAWDVNRVNEEFWWTVMARGVFRYAVGPIVGRGGAGWRDLAEFYARCHSYTTDGAVVHWGGDVDELAKVPKRYPVLLEVADHWHPWELDGRVAWLAPGNFVAQWQRYCELRMCGIKVGGLLLEDIYGQIHRWAGKVIGGDLWAATGVDGTGDERFAASAMVLADWWEAVGRHYD